LARALHMTKFERLTEEDGYSLLRFKRLLFATD